MDNSEVVDLSQGQRIMQGQPEVIDLVSDDSDDKNGSSSEEKEYVLPILRTPIGGDSVKVVNTSDSQHVQSVITSANKTVSSSCKQGNDSHRKRQSNTYNTYDIKTNQRCYDNGVNILITNSFAGQNIQSCIQIGQKRKLKQSVTEIKIQNDIMSAQSNVDRITEACTQYEQEKVADATRFNRVGVVLDSEDLEDIAEQRQLAERAKKRKSEQNKSSEHLDRTVNAMVVAMNDLVVQGVNREQLKEALYQTYKSFQPDESGKEFCFDESWAAAAQVYLAQQQEQRDEQQQMAQAMALSLQEKKQLSDLSLSEILDMFAGKSDLLEEITSEMGYEVVLQVFSQNKYADDFRVALAKLLELEKSCQRWYSLYKPAVQEYFRSQGRAFVDYHKKKQMSTKPQICSLKSYTLKLTNWYKLVSQSVSKFECPEEGVQHKYSAPYVFHKFIKKAAQQQPANKVVVISD